MSTLKLSNLILDFVKNTILGIESGMYKTMRLEIKDTLIKIIQINFLVEYFNKAYSALILNTDQYFVQKFKEMHEELNHSYICLLNITFNFTIQLVQQINRDNLNVNTYELFMKSLEDEIIQHNIFQPSMIEPFISHTCTGIDIKTCNPNEPLFFIKT
jgi:hypothetical protein